MWIDIQKDTAAEEGGSASSAYIRVPASIASHLQQHVNVRFGQRQALADVRTLPEADEQRANGGGDRKTVRLSPALMEGLMIREDLPYRLTFAGDEVRIGPVIGLLLGEQKYIYHDSNMGEYTDALHAYGKTGGLIIAFKIASIDWQEESVHGLYYHGPDKCWKYGKFPLPSVVFLRAYNIDPLPLRQLKERLRGQFFNSVRFDKWQVYQHIHDVEGLREHIPHTTRVTDDRDLMEFMSRYRNIILKPIGLSRARGICIIKQMGSVLQIADYTRGRRRNVYQSKESDLISFLLRRKILNGHYIAQPLLSLASISNSPWDIRVVMQKDARHKWRCNGIECRHAGRRDLITNISRGGQALHISTAARMSFGAQFEIAELKDKVLDVARRFCTAMDQTGEHFAEFGLDIAVDDAQHIWLIEANVRPTFNGFKKMDLRNYLHICTTPLLYAASLDQIERRM